MDWKENVRRAASEKAHNLADAAKKRAEETQKRVERNARRFSHEAKESLLFKLKSREQATREDFDDFLDTLAEISRQINPNDNFLEQAAKIAADSQQSDRTRSMMNFAVICMDSGPQEAIAHVEAKNAIFIPDIIDYRQNRFISRNKPGVVPGIIVGITGLRVNTQGRPYFGGIAVLEESDTTAAVVIRDDGKAMLVPPAMAEHIIPH